MSTLPINVPWPVLPRISPSSSILQGLEGAKHVDGLRIGLVLILLTAAYFLVANRSRPELPYPPGPERDPVLGNLKQKPASFVEKTYAEWGKTYGDVIYLRYGKQDVIILNSAKAAVELLDQRSLIYSSRPPSVMAYHMATRGLGISLTPAGSLFKRHRKAFQYAFGQSKIEALRDPIRLETYCLGRDLIESPTKFESHLKRFASSIVFSTVYDHRIMSPEDPVLEEIIESNKNFASALRPEGFAVDHYPILRFLPEFLSPWRRQGRKWFEFEFGIYKRYFDQVQQRIDQGQAPNCVTTHVIENQKENKLSRDEATFLTGSMIAAGSDSTAMTLTCLIMAACLNPDKQRECQLAIDEVLGPAAEADRLPAFEDVDQIPLLKAFVQEVHRWRPFAPAGTPHYAQKDDVYRGWHIPKGSIVLANITAIHNDPETWPEPDTFMPERHLEENILRDRFTSARTLFTFGHGRRMCPGKALAILDLNYASLMLLWAFDFQLAKDDKGNLIPIDPMAFEDGAVVHPYPFKCSIRPRSKAIEELLLHSPLEL